MTIINQIKVPFEKIRRIIHLADIHVRLFKRHEEYRECFETFYSDLRKIDLNDTVIVVAGDIVHAKTDLSPEMVDLSSDFLIQLATLAPTIVIAGNHDLNVSNPNRLDALSPIVRNIKHNNLHYLKRSGIYQFGDVDFYVWSLIGDTSDWDAPINTGRTKVCLFHGPVHNAKTDVGYTITNRHIMLENFDGFDMVLLGDIHRHQILQQFDSQQKKPIVVYASSLIQQNHGETLEGHGWCEWDVANKSFEFHELKNRYGYYTLRIEDDVIPDYSDMPENVHLRIFAGSMDQVTVKKLVTKIRSERNVKECSVINFSQTKRISSNVKVGNVLDITDVNVQNTLIVDYLKSTIPDLPPDTLDRVIDINRWANTEISTDDIARKILWVPLSLKYDNLFTYGDNNYINFKDLKSVIGIFAPNASGKTSIAEAICFALYDRTPRTTRSVNIMNTRRDTCFCEFRFEIDKIEYVIERKGTKNKKGEVKIDVNFYKLENGQRISLNGEERRYTNANIRSYVGDYEDFILTTFSSSSTQGLFVDRGQSDRKDLLGQFMGLTILDKLYYVANDKIKEVSGALKNFKHDDFTQELVDVQGEITKLNSDEFDLEFTLNNLNEKLSILDDHLNALYERKVRIDLTLDINTLESNRSAYQEQLEKIDVRKIDLCNKDAILRDKLNIANEKILQLSTVEDEYKNRKEIENVYSKLLIRLDSLYAQRRMLHKQIIEYSGHKYDPNCNYCIKNGHTSINGKLEAENNLQKIIDEITTLESDKFSIEMTLENTKDISNLYEKYLVAKRWIETAKVDLMSNTTEITQLDIKRTKLVEEINTVDREIEHYYKSIDDIKHNEQINSEISQINAEKNLVKQGINQINSKMNQLVSSFAVLSLRKNDMLDRIRRARELEEKYQAYEAYLKSVCRDGLPYKLISEILPSLEMSVNELLNQIVSFILKFETDGKNINIKICYDTEKMWPLELASGMEKFISGLAIRVALTSISSLPKSNFLIIDEGLGTLDPDNLSSMFMLFDVLRTQFEFILLISHVDSVRDIADSLIEIHRDDGFSRIYHS